MSPKVRMITAWVVAVLVAGLFIMAGIPKVNPNAINPEMVENFEKWGYGLTFMKVIGVLEILGAIGLLIPRIWHLAALGLMGLMGGAAYTHLTAGETSAMGFPIGLIVVLLIYMFLRRSTSK